MTNPADPPPPTPLPEPFPLVPARVTTQDLLLRGAGGLLIFIIGLWAIGVFLGYTRIPQATQDAVWPFLTPLLVAAFGALTIYFQRRQTAELRDGLGSKIGAAAATQTTIIAAQVADALATKTAADAAALAVKVETDAKAAVAARLLSDAQLEASRIIEQARAEAQRLLLTQQVAALPSQIAAIPNITSAASGISTADIVDAVDRTTAAAEQIAANTIGPIAVIPVDAHAGDVPAGAHTDARIEGGTPS